MDLGEGRSFLHRFFNRSRRADLAQLALNFPLESRRGPNGGYRLSTQPPFAKHASFLALLMADLERVGRLNQQQEQLMQEAILALISFRIDEAVHLPYRH